MALKKRSRRFFHRSFRLQFLGVSFLSLASVFTIAMLTRAELRLSGEVLGAGDADDLSRIFALHDCVDVQNVRQNDDVRLYLIDCTPYDYLVESTHEKGEWEIKKVERVRE